MVGVGCQYSINHGENKTARNIEEKKYHCSQCNQSFGVKQDLPCHDMVFHKDQNDPSVIALRTKVNNKKRKINR